MMIAFGPVPSRRLGRSLGINNIPPKLCTYSCIYCQLGRTGDTLVERTEMCPPKELVSSIKQKVSEVMEKGKVIDYLSFVPDGEPTLDLNLGKEIELLRELGIKIAVISNSSLVWQRKVQQDLAKADVVSLKIDTVKKRTWKTINRPHKSLELDRVMEGVKGFSQKFNGSLLTETMLVRDINDSEEEIDSLGNFITKLDPEKSFITTPVRPPAEKRVKKTCEHSLNYAYQHFKDRSIPVEALTGHEEPYFVSSGDVEEDLLSITSVHPMRKESLKKLLESRNEGWGLVKRLLDEDKLVEVEYGENKFYMRKLRG
ncbi:MAG: radical SAM protein [Archaeoglobaceae archaeon]